MLQIYSEFAHLNISSLANGVRQKVRESEINTFILKSAQQNSCQFLRQFQSHKQMEGGDHNLCGDNEMIQL